jgi:hypothetical protein
VCEGCGGLSIGAVDPAAAPCTTSIAVAATRCPARMRIYTISPAAVRTSSNSGIWLVRIAGKKPEFQLVEAADRGFFHSPRTEARPL